ncbi:MAG TPA: SagB/ThcOx family dehydrogenase [Methanospirillum sp.]|nr:SagB/ThcOx family dehydrogenase [Methanospirillum sp.]
MPDKPQPNVCGVCEPNQKIIPLPRPADISFEPALLCDVMDTRRTVRDYSSEPLYRWELSLMLHYTQGIRSEEEGTQFRTVPSAGALHPFETHLVINRVEGIECGIYRYLPLDHALVQEICHVGDPDAVAQACRRPELVQTSAVTFIWTAIAERILWKFGSRGWRYLFIEAGHICQNLYLISKALECGTCAIGSYHDQAIHCALGLDEDKEFCVYMASVGRPNQ